MSVALKSFSEVFPSENVRHHFVGQDQAKGVYAKELHIPEGMRLVSHAHRYDHLSILASGEAILTRDRVKTWLMGPCAVTIAAGIEHEIEALTDAVWFCIHPTDETDAEKADETLIEKSH